ncbi:MAG: hypothetical protein PHR26_01395 [Candidatus ainarchaeum sp.]|nr:hypothetical protein [Candidatus ainarchaeum sp.]MDD3976293.1 hypothetical protein [Candidatus ainarchaeum sp.]
MNENKLIGTIGIVIGSILTILGIFFIFPLIYGLPILLISLFILFNKKEDEIEQIKKL